VRSHDLLASWLITGGEWVGHYWELSATTTTTDGKSYTYGRLLGREGEQYYLKILLIGQEMVGL
jgi:hypothetical protein